MSNILSSLSKTVISGFILLIVIIFLISESQNFILIMVSYLFFRWLHVLSGVMWIGLLWYFNFVQIPSMPNIPDDQKTCCFKSYRTKSFILV